MILVVGANGTTGKEVVRELKAAKAPFRVLVRSGKVAKALKEAGTEAFVGDLEKPKTLDAALDGVERVFVATSADPNIARLHGGLYAAAKKAGAKHVVRMGALGASASSPVTILKWHGDADEALKASGLAWTLLRPHFFMQNFVTFYAGSISAQDAFYLPFGTARLGMVDVRDIAAVAARALTVDGHAGKTYEVTGPEVLSMAEAARTLSQVAGRTITYSDVSPEAARGGMIHAKMPPWLADGLVALFADYRAGKGAVLSTAVLDATGRMARSFQKFCSDHRDAFQKG